jgi:hypothetical protein
VFSLQCLGVSGLKTENCILNTGTGTDAIIPKIVSSHKRRVDANAIWVYACGQPVENFREANITGVQSLARRFIELLHRVKIEYNLFESTCGREMDRLPMTEPGSCRLSMAASAASGMRSQGAR